MDEKLYVTLRTPADAQKVRDAGCTILAEYPDSLIARGSAAQRQALEAAGVEATPYEQRPVQVSGTTFAFSSAVAANAATPVPAPPPDRRAYYLVVAVGPIK